MDNEDAGIDDGRPGHTKYREKRRKNNEAARRSREKKRKHEIQLEEQVMELKDENDRFVRELMRAQMFNRELQGMGKPSAPVEQSDEDNLLVNKSDEIREEI